VYDFLLVINSNPGPISHCYWDTATYCPKIANFAHPPHNNVTIVSVIVQSNSRISQFLHQMFNVSSLLLDDTLKPVTPLTNGAINQTLRQFAPLSASAG